MLLSSMLADRYQAHSWVIVGLSTVTLFAYIVFWVWSSNIHLIMAAYYVGSAYGAVAPLISAWLNSCCGGDKQLRALTTSLMFSIG